MNEFICPKLNIKEFIKIGLTLSLYIISITFCLHLLIENPNYKSALITLAWFIIWMCILPMPLALLILMRRNKKLKILISDQSICFLNGDKQRSIQWNDIMEVKVFESNKGEIYNILLRNKNHKGMGIRGLEKQREIVNLIEEYISENTKVKINRDKLNWEFIVTRVPAIIIFVLIILYILINY